MAIISTQRNTVYAYDPQPDDVFVRIAFIGPAKGQDLLFPRVTTPRHLPFRPIAEYAAEVEFAVGIADQFARPIHVRPFTFGEFLREFWKVMGR